MSRRVSDDRLGSYHLRLSDLVRQREGPQWLDYKGQAVIEGHDLIAMLDELRQRRREGGKAGTFNRSPTTRALMAMAVGDVITLPPITNGALTTNRATARKAMNAPDARWHAMTQPDGTVRVERRPDGSPHEYGLPRNPVIDQLAGMNVNGRITIGIPLTNKFKVLARQKLNKPDAQWRTMKLANGKVRVIRTA